VNKQLTIVIPCKNEGKSIINTLKLIGKQHLDCLIIIADSSDDNITPQLIKEHLIHSPQIVKLIKGGLPAVARNNGARLVSTPYVLFLDADIYLYNAALIANCLKVIIDKHYDLVTCKFKTIESKYNWVYNIFNVIQWISSKTKPFALGGFMLFKTETFNKLGGFNEEDKVAEDYHLSSKIKPSKFKVINQYAYTTGRRFKKKGVWYMVKLAWKAWLNRNNNEWFKQDYDYWK
jgi:glycosyltransferase involved in cell wall biosynthesis